MYAFESQIITSATDLAEYLECEHLLQLERRAALGELTRPVPDDPGLALLSRLGQEHEAEQLARLRAEHGPELKIADWGNSPTALSRADGATRSAMTQGARLIYQATMFDGRWLGKADFLIRVDRPSGLGDYSYEVVDAKLARHAKTRALLQTTLYSEQVGRLQGNLPNQMHLILGDGRQQSFAVGDYTAFTQSARHRLEAALAAGPVDTYPEPVEYCNVCRWREGCQKRRSSDDHLSLVAAIRSDQIKRLRLAGVETMAALAATSLDQVPGISDRAYARIRRQAQLQVEARSTGRRIHELIDAIGPGIGLGALPPPASGDLFFDMEGDPYFHEEGLEYLFGVLEQNASRPRFRAFWAHDREQEKRAFEAFMDFVMERWDADPALHVYHYAAYEPVALKRLVGRHATREEELDRMLRGGLFVDLYQVVRQGVRVSEESYSLKSIEHFYLAPRAQAVTDAGSSIVAYERWRSERRQELLDGIEDYNRADCESTWGLRGWLEARRLEATEIFGVEVPRPLPRESEVEPPAAARAAATAALTARLLAGVPEERDDRSPDQQGRWLLAHSLSWHRREEKSDWWAHFDRIAKTDDELVDDPDSIGGLSFLCTVGQIKRSVIHRYAFDPEQEYKIDVGDKPLDPRTGRGVGEVDGLDRERGTIDLRWGTTSVRPHPSALIPAKPVMTDVLRGALDRLGAAVAAGGLGAAGAAADLLRRSPPSLRPAPAAGPLCGADEDPARAAQRIASLLQGSYLAVQGPPGTGKTRTAGMIIAGLADAGFRVGISASSHKVIANLLAAVAEAAAELGHQVRRMQKCDPAEPTGDQSLIRIDSNSAIYQSLAAGEVDVVGGTPWLWSREEAVGSLDYLFIDEAGQMSLANVLAVSGATTNLVLLGDPQQLSQPSKGAHPSGSDVSGLGHVLAGNPTIDPELGILLSTSWRMHPLVCEFVSEVAYDGRLESDPSCRRQAISSVESDLRAGLRFIPVPHRGNRTTSPEEIEVVVGLFERLRRGTWIDKTGACRAMNVDDLLVVAPFNAHVARLKTALPEGARVGTVDKFQGQEAPVVIYSMASSSADDAPRGIEFLYSLNRLNVATSRAKALAIIVCSPQLLLVRPRSPDQIRLANALCLFSAMAARS
ncbi:MAG TPA: TM0106 family RecB-like putative nuclease [Candidatus Nitrosotalea sp.]|nr:TM0106 family RecB-like putative nuclease [Candidatus Nitrosotalea sp.]